VAYKKEKLTRLHKVIACHIYPFDNNISKKRNIMNLHDKAIKSCLTEESSEGMMVAWCRNTEKMIKGGTDC